MNADLVIRHANLATMSAPTGFGEIEDGAVVVADGLIVWVGKDSDLPSGLSSTAEIDGGGRWLTPGLIDCHTHLVWAGNRANEFEMRLEGKSYEEIARAGGGILATVRATRAATENELFTSAARRLRTLMAEGVTTVEIKSGYGLDLETELKILRVIRRLKGAAACRIEATFLGAHTIPPEFSGRPDAYVDLVCDEMLPTVSDQQLASAIDVFCERIAFSPDQTRKIFQKAKSLGLKVKLHADQLCDSEGAGLVAAAGGLSADHVEYTCEDSVRAMSEAGTVAVLLPGAFYSLKETQKPPIELFRRYGVPMAVATDLNPGTSPFASLQLMLNMACVLFGLTPAEAFRGVTKNAARALGLDGIGVLEVGARADLALFEIDHPRDLCAGFQGGRLTHSWFGGVAAA